VSATTAPPSPSAASSRYSSRSTPQNSKATALASASRAKSCKPTTAPSNWPPATPHPPNSCLLSVNFCSTRYAWKFFKLKTNHTNLFFNNLYKICQISRRRRFPLHSPNFRNTRYAWKFFKLQSNLTNLFFNNLN